MMEFSFGTYDLLRIGYAVQGFRVESTQINITIGVEYRCASHPMKQGLARLEK
jgi:hypothetical protein